MNLSSCSKDSLDCDITKSFYTYDRNVIFSEKFKTPNPHWKILLDGGFFRCDTGNSCQAYIGSGLHLKTGGMECEGCVAEAKREIPNIHPDYLAAEVHFDDFIMSIGHVGSSFEQNLFYFGLGDAQLFFGLNFDAKRGPFKYEVDMDLSGHVVHFLIDMSSRQTYAYSDKIVTMNDGNPASGGKDLSGLTTKSSGSIDLGDNVVFSSRDGFADMVGPWASRMSIRSIEIYEPLPPCQ